MNQIARTARRGGRDSRRALRKQESLAGMLPHLERGLPYTEPMAREQIERIHDASMAILEEVGVDFRDPTALADWKRAGARVDGERVYLDRLMVMELIASIPAEITLHARDPQKSVTLGEGKSIFVPMTGAPFIRDLEDVRRWGRLADLNNFHKLAHMAPALHSSAHVICEPMDVPVGHRHLWITYSSMRHSDKTFMGMSTGAENGEDVMEMVKILFGAEYVETHPVVTANINGN
jgi:trimethylamine--corrinoid protein Co-methyltransferase